MDLFPDKVAGLLDDIAAVCKDFQRIKRNIKKGGRATNNCFSHFDLV
jgi:hypothetical protein